jgi:uncharacterized SAM-binding protein YcdF (DUF218 family)
MFIFLSKFLPLFVYPLGLACLLLIISFLFKPESKWLKIILGTTLGILWICGTNYFSVSLVRSLEWQYLPPEELPTADMIVVLGGGSRSAEYPRQIVDLSGAADRTFYASWLYHQGVASEVLLTGGYIPWMGETEGSPAENMAFIMDMLGVPEDALILEKESLNTYENAVNTKAILNAEGIDRIILVTSASHMPRSVGLFEKQGFEVISAPTDYTVTQADWEQLWEPDLTTQVFNLIPNAGNLDETTKALKEYIGILIYTLRGWI